MLDGVSSEAATMTTRKAISKTSTKKTGGPRSAGRLQRALDETARREITLALTEARGNVSEAARALGVSRIALYARMKSLHIGSR